MNISSCQKLIKVRWRQLLPILYCNQSIKLLCTTTFPEVQINPEWLDSNKKTELVKNVKLRRKWSDEKVETKILKPLEQFRKENDETAIKTLLAKLPNLTHPDVQSYGTCS